MDAAEMLRWQVDKAAVEYVVLLKHIQEKCPHIGLRTEGDDVSTGRSRTDEIYRLRMAQTGFFLERGEKKP